MDDETLRTVLEDAGLSPYQAAAYVALLDLGSATATDVASASSVPDPRIYDVLRDLDERGYVETYQGDRLTVRAHDPETVLSDLRDRSSEYLTAAEEIEARWQQPAVADHEVNIVNRFRTVLNRSREILSEATDEVVLGATAEQYREVRPALVDAHERDVVVNVCLYADETGEPVPATEELTGSCREARHRDLLAPYLLVVDRQWTCFAPERRSFNEYGVLVNDATHTNVFHWFFRSVLWETWETIFDARNDSLPLTFVDLVECLRTVVPLLEDGLVVEATVEGTDTATRDRVTLSGRIVDADHSGEVLERDELIPLAPLAGRNSLTLETADGSRYEVGGWAARVEDVEARRVTITAIEES